MDLLILPPAGRMAPLLAAELAGRTLAEHLRANAAACSWARAPDAAAGAERLYIRPDAWFSAQAFAHLAARTGSGKRPQVVVIMAASEPLAAYVSSDQAALPEDALPESPADALQALIARGDRVLRLDAAELDPVFPPRRITNLLDVAQVEKLILLQRAQEFLLSGVRIRDPERIAIRGELDCGNGVEIDLDVIIEGRVSLGDGVHVGPSCVLRNARLGKRSRVNAFSIVEDATVGDDSFVGPFGRVRPGTVIGERGQIGSFVEIKNACIGDGARINHLAFVGDAVLGNDVTVGAGVITCNHDGTRVHTTRIGDGAYVGSGSELVAPVSIGAQAFIAAGSTVTRDAPPGKLTLARARQVSVDRRRGEKPGTGGG